MLITKEKIVDDNGIADDYDCDQDKDDQRRSILSFYIEYCMRISRCFCENFAIRQHQRWQEASS